MVVPKIAYVCDCCSRTEYLDTENLSDDYIPEGWHDLPKPFGLMCKRCYKEILDVYNRIKLPNRLVA